MKSPLRGSHKRGHCIFGAYKGSKCLAAPTCAFRGPKYKIYNVLGARRLVTHQ